MTKASNRRAALYARYSSDIQKDTSVEDQFVELEKAAKRFGFKGKVPKQVITIERAGDFAVLVPRGGYLRARRILREHGLAMRVEDRRSLGREDLREFRRDTAKNLGLLRIGDEGGHARILCTEMRRCNMKKGADRSRLS